MWFEISWFGRKEYLSESDRQEFFKLICFTKGAVVNVKFGIGPDGIQQCALPDWLKSILEKGFSTYMENCPFGSEYMERMYQFVSIKIGDYYEAIGADQLYKPVSRTFYDEKFTPGMTILGILDETKPSDVKTTHSIDECMDNLANAIFEKDGRIEWDDYFLYIARIVSLRSTCIRRKYGAVIVKDNKI